MLKSSAFLIMLFFCSCHKDFETREAIIAHILEEENGYRFTKNINGVTFTLQYRPTDLLVEQEIKDSNAAAVEDIRESYSKFLYFNLSFSKNGNEILNGMAGNRDEFGQLINQLAFGMDDNIHLVTSAKDTIKMIDYNFSRTYGLSDSNSLIIVYPRTEEVLNKEYFNIIIQDLGLSTGDVAFKVKTKPLKNEPSLNIY